MTWNLGFVSDGNDIGGSTWEDDAARASFIASEILSEQAELDTDVIAVMEAFDVDAQTELNVGLEPEFPHRVLRLESNEAHEQDSGLMLFSRFRFSTPDDSLGISAFYADPVNGRGHAITTACPSSSVCVWPDVAFDEYTDCDGWDCWAAKGIGLVQLLHPGTNERINVGFTHLQATYGGDVESSSPTRDGQFQQIEAMFRRLPNLERQVTLLLGDLNVSGQSCTPTDGCTGFIEDPDAFTFEDTEWERRMWSTGSDQFWSCNFPGSCPPGAVFRDGWASTMPAEDWGRSGDLGPSGWASDSGNRLDYVLHSIPDERRVCVQHMRVLRHLATHDTMPSDHLPVWAEINARAPHCDVPNALVFAPNASGAMPVAGTITYPRSVQWARIDEAGTFTLEASETSPVTLEVYAASDISYPIAPIESFARRTVFHLPDPPYYVKATPRDRTFTGAYSYVIRQHHCRIGDCCFLNPGDDPLAATWSGSLTDSGDRWFCFDTDVADSGAFPTVVFDESDDCSNDVRLDLFERVGNGPGAHIPWSVIEGVSPALDATTSLAPGHYMVRAAQQYVMLPVDACDTRVEMQTNLTYVRFDSLGCADETGASGTLEEVGADEIWMSLRLSDGGGYCAGSTDVDEYGFLQSMEEDDHPTHILTPLGVRRFLNCASFDLLEADDSPPDPDDVTYLAPRLSIAHLDEDETSLEGHHWFDSGDYAYLLEYSLRHTPFPN
ncbi:MAG: endonuclease/exonuclease/phosphatase family protein [Sandaracinaceae bacterium]